MSHRSAILDLIIEHLFDMEKGVVTAVTALVPSGARDRLVQARLALRLAEERTGLRDAAALEVQRAVSSAPTSPSMSAASAAAGSSQTASLMALTAAQDSGALSLQGSATLLLAALALRQGSADWCAAVGADEVGWCAAVEGSYVNGSERLAEIVSNKNKTVVATFQLNPSDYGRIEQDGKVAIHLPDGQLVEGWVMSVNIGTDETSKKTITEVTVTSDGLQADDLTLLTRRNTPVNAVMSLRDDGPLAGPTQTLREFLVKIGLR